MSRLVRENLIFVSWLKRFCSDQALHLANKFNYPLFFGEGVCIAPRWIQTIAVAGALVAFEAHALCSTTLGASPTPLSDFVVDNDGTVTHSKTGLIWKRCEEGQSGSSCEIGASQVFTWFDALAVAKDSAFAGNNDWRLPSKQELMSIVDETCFFPSINELVFPNTAPRSVWSSTTITAFPANAWFVEFGYASSGHGSKLSSVARNGVRLVRGGQSFDASPASPVDSVAPDTAITSAPVTGTANTVSVLFSGTDNVGVTGFECRLDSAAFSSCTSPISLTGLGLGAHTFSVRALDAAGNRDATPAIATWAVVAGMGDSDSDGMPDAVELSEARTIGLKDNAIFSGMNAKSDRWFAMQQYRDFLSREAETAGLAGWTNILTAGTQSREQAIQSFFNSQEFQNGVPPVVRLYLGYFNRIPDHDGLFGWVSALRGGAALGTVSGAFAASQEFQNTYGALSNADFVTLVYRNVLGRAPDTAGFDGWLAQLNAGLTRGNMMIGFTESQEYQNNTRNNVFVIMMYEGMLRRAAEQAGYEGWVNYMNAGGSGLDLTRGFLNSLEYRYRFLPG
jgi:hypothetical protein